MFSAPRARDPVYPLPIPEALHLASRPFARSREPVSASARREIDTRNAWSRRTPRAPDAPHPQPIGDNIVRAQAETTRRHRPSQTRANPKEHHAAFGIYRDRMKKPRNPAPPRRPFVCRAYLKLSQKTLLTSPATH